MKTKFLTGGAVAVLLSLLIAPTVASASGGYYPLGGDGHGFGRGAAVVSIESSTYGSVLVVGRAGAGYDPTWPGADSAGYRYPAGSSLVTSTRRYVAPFGGWAIDKFWP